MTWTLSYDRSSPSLYTTYVHLPSIHVQDRELILNYPNLLRFVWVSASRSVLILIDIVRAYQTGCGCYLEGGLLVIDAAGAVYVFFCNARSNLIVIVSHAYVFILSIAHL